MYIAVLRAIMEDDKNGGYYSESSESGSENDSDREDEQEEEADACTIPDERDMPKVRKYNQLFLLQNLEPQNLRDMDLVLMQSEQ